MKTFLIATKNTGKAREIIALLPRGIKILTLKDLKISEVEETGKTYEENALIKAKYYGSLFNMPTIAEDSGLEVYSLGKRPGIKSARYKKGNDSVRINKLLRELEKADNSNRKARFVAVAAFYDPKNGSLKTGKGIAEGKILLKPLGNNGFGYDPIFFSNDLQKTFGQASEIEKSTVSHRKKAIKNLLGKVWKT